MILFLYEDVYFMLVRIFHSADLLHGSLSLLRRISLNISCSLVSNVVIKSDKDINLTEHFRKTNFKGNSPVVFKKKEKTENISCR